MNEVVIIVYKKETKSLRDSHEEIVGLEKYIIYNMVQLQQLSSSLSLLS